MITFDDAIMFFFGFQLISNSDTASQTPQIIIPQSDKQDWSGIRIEVTPVETKTALISSIIAAICAKPSKGMRFLNPLAAALNWNFGLIVS